MALHLAITARDFFIEQLLDRVAEIPDAIRKITLVSSPDANNEDIEDNRFHDLLERYNYDVLEYGKVDWKDVDLYLYNDNLENLKFLTGAAAQSVLSIDLSGYSATLDQMPVVIPRLDESQLEEVQEKKMVALPHPQVSQLLYVLDHLHRNQQFMYVSVTNLFPVTFVNDMKSAQQLAQETRDYFNMTGEQSDQYLAFNLNQLADLAPQLAANFEAQVRRLCPSLDSVTVQNIVTPVFFGTTQLVSVTLTNGNTIDDGLVADWLGGVQDFEGIGYRVNSGNPRRFMNEVVDESSDDEESKGHMLELSSVETKEYLKWQTITDNATLVCGQTIELIKLLYREGVIKENA